METGENITKQPIRNGNGRILYRGSFVFWFCGVCLLVACEQAIKKIIFSIPVPQHAGWFGLAHFFNDRFAFSLPVPVVFMYGIYFFVLAAIAAYLKFQWGALTRLSRFAWALIVAGAVSNIGERLLLGSVRDYIRLSTGIFNLADGYILMGMFILLWVSHTPNPKK